MEARRREPAAAPEGRASAAAARGPLLAVRASRSAIRKGDWKLVRYDATLDTPGARSTAGGEGHPAPALQPRRGRLRDARPGGGGPGEGEGAPRRLRGVGCPARQAAVGPEHQRSGGVSLISRAGIVGPVQPPAEGPPHVPQARESVRISSTPATSVSDDPGARGRATPYPPRQRDAMRIKTIGSSTTRRRSLGAGALILFVAAVAEASTADTARRAAQAEHRLHPGRRPRLRRRRLARRRDQDAEPRQARRRRGAARSVLRPAGLLARRGPP